MQMQCAEYVLYRALVNNYARQNYVRVALRKCYLVTLVPWLSVYSTKLSSYNTNNGASSNFTKVNLHNYDVIYYCNKYKKQLSEG
jgi:hypothetical protein